MSESKENSLYYLSLIVVIILFFGVEYSLISKGFFALSADESAHTLESYEWFTGEGHLFSIWLPFYKIINGLALKIHYDLVITPRAVSLLFGLLTLISLMILTYQLFENRVIVLLTGFFAAIFSPIAIFSVLPLTEIFYFFFIVASITCLLLWLKTLNRKYLALVIFLLMVSTTIRFEAWIFSAIIFCIIGYEIFKSQRTQMQKIIWITSIGLALASFPLYWSYLSSISGSDSNGFVSAVTSRYKEGKIITEIKNNSLYLFFVISVNSLNIIGLASLIYLYKINNAVKKFSVVLLGSLLTFSILSFFINAMPTHHYWRVAMIWSLLLLPFTVYTLDYFLENSKSSPMYRYLFVIIFLLLIYFIYTQTQQYSTESYLTNGDIEAGEYINELSKNSSDKFYVIKDGSDKWRYNNLLVSSQHPKIFIENLENFGFSTSDTITVNEKLLSELGNKQIRYLVVPSQKFLSTEPKLFSEIFNNPNWNIFELKL